MKTILLFISVLLLQVCCNAQNINMNGNKKGYIKSVFKIVRIDSIQNVYIIYAKKNKMTVKIVSKRNDSCFNSIKVDKSYKLTITSLFPPNTHHRLDIAGILYEKIFIRFENENGIVRDLFTSEELNGLCYSL